MAKYILYGITGIAWLVALVWVLVEPGFEPLLALLAGCATLVGTFWLPKHESTGEGPQVTFSNEGENTGQQAGVVHGGMNQNQQNIHNHAPNQGAQGTFHGPLTFDQRQTTFDQRDQQVQGDQYNAGGDINQGTVDARDANFSGAQGVNISGVTIDRRRQRDEGDDE
jgi:hypothetical protein